MTSQVILINASGVAIASDSAMTFGNNRVYDTAEKIFPLPNPHRVAVLHSGAVFLQDFTYQLLITEWATSLGSVQLRSVDQYQQNFLDWLNDNIAWFSTGKQFAWAKRIVNDRLHQQWTQCKEKLKEGTTTATEIERYISLWTNELKDFPSNFGVQSNLLNYVMQELKDYLDKRIAYWFDDVPFRDETKELLLADIRVFIEKGMWLDEANLAFCGYGSNELMPAYATLSMRGVLGNNVIFQYDKSYQYDANSNSRHYSIVPLGQITPINEFLQGIEIGIVNLVQNTVYDAIKETLETVRTHLGSEFDSTLNTLRTKYFSEVDRRINEHIGKRTDKIIGVIPSLPAASLASYAGSLIDLVALRLSIDGEMNTVGGPIDTAIITRSNGFQWIRHKSIS